MKVNIKNKQFYIGPFYKDLDYKILEEENNFVNGWWLYEEIYIKDNQYELHVLIDAPYEGSTKLGYFTIRAKNIVFYTQKNK